MDEPLPELKQTVHEFGGLKPSASQEPLPDLLAKVGAKADELLKSVPDLISDESVSQTQHPVSQGIIPGCSGIGGLAAGRSSGWDQNFSYLILTHPAPNGRFVLQEYRTARNGKPVQHGTAAPSFSGFVSAWIVFTSANRVESRFRYLGEQKTDGHNALVIGFAQIPALVESPRANPDWRRGRPDAPSGHRMDRSIGFQHHSSAYRLVGTPAQDWGSTADG